MGTVLIIGASGFVGKNLAKSFLADGCVVRCFARNSARVQDLAAAGCDVFEGDIADLASVERAVECVETVYISIHTLSPQRSRGATSRFMDAEKSGLQNVVAAGRSRGVRRVVYVTSLGVSADAPSEWLRERWHAEQSLLNSGLDTTVVRPGFIVGVGGRGFDTFVGHAKRRVTVSMGGERPRMRTIAVDDLVYYLRGVIDKPTTCGHAYDVGSDDVLSINGLIDTIANVLCRPSPVKLRLPPSLLGLLAPAIERVSKLPRGAIRGLADGMKVDMIGDPAPIRAILPGPLLSFREAVKRVLAVG